MTPATMITFEGHTKAITEWALDYGITPGIIIGRLERGDTITDAITTPMKVGHPGQRLPPFYKQRTVTTGGKHAFNGKSHTLREWADLLGIKYGTLCARIARLGSVDAAIDQGRSLRPRRGQAPGVSSNFVPSQGTGAGSTAQESAQIDFSGKANIE